jgi:hypothetical protein
MTSDTNSNEQKAETQPQGFYLYVTPWVAYGHLRRPCWLLRIIQRVLLGWRWYANEHDTIHAMRVMEVSETITGTSSGPYSVHLPEWPGMPMKLYFAPDEET